MAKPRKPKNDDSGPLVRHQKLCLAIDLENRCIYGHTELEIAVPDNGIVALHADNLEIDSISIDGEPVQYDIFPHFQPVEIENRWCSVSTPTSAADAAGATYIAALDRELMPNLLIFCSKPVISDQQAQDQTDTGDQSSDEQKQNVKLVRIDYWVEKAESGIHFADNLLYTDNQIRRARCWFPCFDDVLQQCCYDLEFTVAHNLVAVSTGELLYQVLSKDDPPSKTYVYKVGVPVAAQWISLAVGPFQIVPDMHSDLISHMCFPPKLLELRNTTGFFHTAFSYFEKYLSAPFPFGSYKQVFIAPELAISSFNIGASMTILSSQILYDEKIIDQAIDTRTKLAYALARQWFGVFITPESPNDGSIGLYGQIRAWKSVAVLQMLEKQMGPESFCKILQRIIGRAQQTSNPIRTLSTKEFRQFANKIGNLERPFLREFFPRWVSSPGCPVLRMGFSFNKRKNMVELAVLRECSAASDPSVPSVNNGNIDSENRESDNGWPGMMSIRVHELDGSYDHPILSMAGDTCQLLEIQCHSKIATKRLQKPKKGSKADGSDDNGDMAHAQDTRSNAESPLLWLRADPEMEYLAEIHFNQPVQMWINQLEKDKDVVAQAQAITTLEALPRLSFSVVNALSSFLSDSKAFWRVRIDAAFALASTASEDTDWAGLLHLVKFYKSRRFDTTIGLPKPNDFHDFAEYFVLEAIPKALASIRASDKKSPREAVEFVLQLLKYNDNNGNPYSDAFWLAALVQCVGQLEFGQQSVILLSSLLKRLDRLLQFDRLMPSYNGILTVSCIRSLTQTALKLSGFIPLDRVYELIEPYRDVKMIWQVRVEANRALLDLKFYGKGIDDALLLFIKYLKEEPYIRGQVKLSAHAVRLCQIKSESESNNDIKSPTLVALLSLLESQMAFNNVFLRHNLFCILQVLALRPPTLFGVPRNPLFRLGNFESSNDQFADVLTKNKPQVARTGHPVHSYDNGEPLSEAPGDIGLGDPQVLNEDKKVYSDDNLHAGENDDDPVSLPKYQQGAPDSTILYHDNVFVPEHSRDANTVSNSQGWRMPVVKIKVKRSAASSKADEGDKPTSERSHVIRNDNERGATSSNSVDAPAGNIVTAVGTRNQNFEESNSFHNHGSHVSASIGSVKITSDFHDSGKDLQCTADSSRLPLVPPEGDPNPASILGKSSLDVRDQEFGSLPAFSDTRQDQDGGSLAELEAHLHGGDPEEDKKKKMKKDKEMKRKKEVRKDDPEYLEKKRVRKEKKRQKMKEMGIAFNPSPQPSASFDLHAEVTEPSGKQPIYSSQKLSRSIDSHGQINEPCDKQTIKTALQTSNSADGHVDKVEQPEQAENQVGSVPAAAVTVTNPAAKESSGPPKFRIKIKNRTLEK
uniref:Transcription initiation factor TFIID subunit 2 n=1 Tax=Kalanchoe fedtschenkoi TaxID=63787 RepID=A0A7N0ZVB9_KALFE